MEESSWEAWVLAARGFWILCECGVWRQSEIETRGVYFRAGHPLAGPVCCVGSSFLGRAHRVPCQGELCSLLLSIVRSELGSMCVPGPDCSVLLALLLWTLVTVGEASVRLASPWWKLQLLLLWWDCLKKRLKIILNYFCRSQIVLQKLFIQALTKCDKIPFIKGV